MYSDNNIYTYFFMFMLFCLMVLLWCWDLEQLTLMPLPYGQRKTDWLFVHLVFLMLNPTEENSCNRLLPWNASPFFRSSH